MNVQGPDGATYQFPDDATEQEIVEFFGQASQPAQQAGKPAGQLDWVDRNIGVPLGIVNVDPATGTATRAQSPLHEPVKMLTQGMPFYDEAEALGGATAGYLKGRGVADVVAGKPGSFGGLYDQEINKVRTENAAINEKNPVLSPILSTIGALASAGPGAAPAAPMTLGQAVKTGAGYGAGFGGLSGFASGEGGIENRLKSAAIGTGTGAALGATLPLAAAGISKAYQAVTGKGAAVSSTKTADLKTQSQAQYKIAEGENLVIAAPKAEDFALKLDATLKKEGIDPALHPKSLATFNRILGDIDKSGDLSLQQLDTLRRIALDAQSAPDLAEKRMAGIIVDKIDDFLDNVSAGDVVSGDPAKASAAITKARELWSRMRKAEAIETAVEKANLRAASTGSGGNADNAIRQNLRGLLTNEKTKRLWTLEEKGLLEFVIKGGRLQNLARLVGKLSPEGSGLMMALGGMAAIPTGGISVAAQTIGFGAKRFADAATPQNVTKLLELVRTGKIPPSAVAMMPPSIQAALRAATQTGAIKSSEIAGALNRPTQSRAR